MNSRAAGHNRGSRLGYSRHRERRSVDGRIPGCRTCAGGALVVIPHGERPKATTDGGTAQVIDVAPGKDAAGPAFSTHIPCVKFHDEGCPPPAPAGRDHQPGHPHPHRLAGRARSPGCRERACPAERDGFAGPGAGLTTGERRALPRHHAQDAGRVPEAPTAHEPSPRRRDCWLGLPAGRLPRGAGDAEQGQLHGRAGHAPSCAATPSPCSPFLVITAPRSAGPARPFSRRSSALSFDASMRPYAFSRRGRCGGRVTALPLRDVKPIICFRQTSAPGQTVDSPQLAQIPHRPGEQWSDQLTGAVRGTSTPSQ